MQKIQKFLFSGIFRFVFCAVAVEDLHEFLAGDGLLLVQILCQLVQLCAVLGQDADGLFVLGLDQLYHLPVDLALGLGTAGQRGVAAQILVVDGLQCHMSNSSLMP